MPCVKCNELAKEIERLKGIIGEVNSWAICYCITTPDDMAQNFPRIVEITSPRIESETEDHMIGCNDCFILRSALVGLVGTDDPDTLDKMRELMESIPNVPLEDRCNTIMAIKALQEIRPCVSQQ